MESALDYAIKSHRSALMRDLSQPFQTLAQQCVKYLDVPTRLDQCLSNVFTSLQSLPQEPTLIAKSRLLYVVTTKGKQLSANVSAQGLDTQLRGQNLAHRPYMQALSEEQALVLSPVYIDHLSHLPCLTAIQVLRDAQQNIIAYLLADFSLLSLPDNAPSDAQDHRAWRQIKGDPAIRGQLFAQQRIMSPMDQQLEQVHDIISALMSTQGVFHAKLHYSSSRATLWLYDEPHAYRVHVLNEIISPEVCLAYPRREYPKQACVNAGQIASIFARFATLRFADETIYLRSASLNIINGYVGLTFSCDGSHYMLIDDFLEKDETFWFG